VLIHAAAGGVGSMAVQLAKVWGASRIVGSASARNAEYVRGLGANEVIDYKTQSFETIAPVNVVIDGIGGDVLVRSWQVLRPGASWFPYSAMPRCRRRLPLKAFAAQPLEGYPAPNASSPSTNFSLRVVCGHSWKRSCRWTKPHRHLS
jgi:NADPH:quinone reductase-like Zn-dependent oxidoreductase